NEIQPVELDVIVLALVNVLDERNRAPALGRPRGQIARYARADVIAAAGLEVFPSNLPGHSRPPFQIVITSRRMVATAWRVPERLRARRKPRGLRHTRKQARLNGVNWYTPAAITTRATAYGRTSASPICEPKVTLAMYAGKPNASHINR